VGTGVVTSLARLGGNVTGLSNQSNQDDEAVLMYVVNMVVQRRKDIRQ
jgi:hypothetical protein